MPINSLLPGGIQVNCAGILNYDGFPSILKRSGGVGMCVDSDTPRTAAAGVITDLGKMKEFQQAAGDLPTLDPGGATAEEWLFTLRSLGSDDLVMIKTSAGQVNSAGDGNEQLSQDSLTLLRHVQEDTVLDFLTTHPEWIASDQ